MCLGDVVDHLRVFAGADFVVPELDALISGSGDDSPSKHVAAVNSIIVNLQEGNLSRISTQPTTFKPCSLLVDCFPIKYRIR